MFIFVILNGSEGSCSPRKYGVTVSRSFTTVQDNIK